MISDSQINKAASEYGVKLEHLTITTLRKAIRAEMEHTKDWHTALKIGLAHLNEYPNYYDRLSRMEHSADRYWSNRAKPRIITSKKFIML